jgi:hypothetical protein
VSDPLVVILPPVATIPLIVDNKAVVLTEPLVVVMELSEKIPFDP